MHDTSFAVEAHLMGDRDWNGGLLRTMVWTTMVAGVLILLVALLNFFHLLAGSFLTRMREFSIRRSGGSVRRQSFRPTVYTVCLVGFAGRPVDRCLHRGDGSLVETGNGRIVFAV